MSRAEVGKLTQYVALGPLPDTAAVSKLVMYALLVPGDDETVEVPARQGFCYGQRVRRG